MNEPNDLSTNMRNLHADLQRSMMEHFQRDLPFEELLFDRWERAKRLGFGEGASIYHNAYVMFDVRVGANTWIGPFVMLDGRGGIQIGEWCSVSTGVHIYTHDTLRWSLTGGRADFDVAPVSVGDRTYLGSQAIILPGSTIGDHCVVGAGSLVNCDLPPYSIAVGAPARVRGRVEIAEATGAVSLRWDD
jgi:acetyltransferase-like isoleucine patch superfamily enzyme